MYRPDRSDFAKSELENEEVIAVNHPNFWLTAGISGVCDAAQAAARRNKRGWTKKSASCVHGVSGARNRWMIQFTVTFGDDAGRFYLTKDGIIMQLSREGFYPINLAYRTDAELNSFRDALNQIDPLIRRRVVI